MYNTGNMAKIEPSCDKGKGYSISVEVSQDLPTAKLVSIKQRVWNMYIASPQLIGQGCSGHRSCIFWRINRASTEGELRQAMKQAAS